MIFSAAALGYLAGAGTLAFITYYLYRQFKLPYLKAWFGSWILVLAAFILLWAGDWEGIPAVIYHAIGYCVIVAGGMTLTQGILLFRGDDPIKPATYSVMLLAAGGWSILALLMKMPEPKLAALPVVVAASFLLYAAWLLLLKQRPGLGHWLAGLGCLFLAISLMVYPLIVIDMEWVSIWTGFSALFTLHISLGLLLLYSRQVGEIIQESEINYRSLFDQNDDAILLANQSGKILEANPQACHLFLKTQEELKNIFIGNLPGLQMFRQINLESFTGGLARRSAVNRLEEMIPVEIDAKRLLDGRWFIHVRDYQQKKQMEDVLYRRDAILKAVSQASAHLLQEGDWKIGIPQILAQLGEAADVSRVYIFENHIGPGGDLLTSQSFEWVAPGISSEINNPILQNASYEQEGWSYIRAPLSNGEAFQLHMQKLDVETRAIFENQGIFSLVLVPIMVSHSWWGYIGFDECRSERTWGEIELDALRVAANVFGAMIQRGWIERALRDSEKRHRLLVENQGAGIGIVDPDEYFTYANPEAERIFGVEANQLTGRNLHEFVSDDQFEVIRRQTANRRTGERNTYEFAITRPDGEVRNLLVTATPYRDERGQWIGSYGIFHDITNRKQAEFRLQQSLEAERTYRQQAEMLREATTALVSQLDLNQVLERVLVYLQQAISYDSCCVFLREGDLLRAVAGRGFPYPGRVLGRTVSFEDYFFAKVSREGQSILLLDAQQDPYFNKWGDAEHVRGWMCVPLLWRQEVLGFLTIDSREVGAYSENELQLAEVFANQAALAIQNSRLFSETQRLAITDSLTGLFNRRYLFDLASRELERARRYSHSLAIILIDFDHFKTINDTYGHIAGDQVLRDVTDQLVNAIRQTDILGRYGGDEMIAVVLEFEPDQLGVIVERMRESIAAVEIVVAGVKIQVTVSMGVAVLTGTDIDLDELVYRADLALYEAKALGRNRVEYWSPALAGLARN